MITLCVGYFIGLHIAAVAAWVQEATIPVLHMLA